jgi:hypothetical protein
MHVAVLRVGAERCGATGEERCGRRLTHRVPPRVG